MQEGGEGASELGVRYVESDTVGGVEGVVDDGRERSRRLGSALRALLRRLFTPCP
jgi:hypothetical protein